MGLEQRAMVLLRDGGSRVRRVEGRRARGLRNELGVAGEVLPWPIGAEKAEPMSERVSERTCMRMEGAMYGTWWDGDGGGRLMRAGDSVCERYADARRSSTMVLSSRMASSTSVLWRRSEPGRVEGAVLARFRDGEGRRESTRPGERVPEVKERRIVVGCSMNDVEALAGSSGQADKVGVCIVAIVVPERRRSCVVVVPLLCTLDRRELETEADELEEPTGLRWMRKSDVEGLEDSELVRDSRSRIRACSGISKPNCDAFHMSSSSKSGNGDKRPLGR